VPQFLQGLGLKPHCGAYSTELPRPLDLSLMEPISNRTGEKGKKEEKGSEREERKKEVT